MILIPLYTRVFSKGENGVIELLDTFFLLLGIVAVLGLDNASARWFYDTSDGADRRKTIGTWFWCQLTISLGIAGLLAGSAPEVSALVTGSRGYTVLVMVAAVTLPFQTLQRLAGNWFRYQRQAWQAVAFSSSTALVNVVLVILLVVVWRNGLAGVYQARLIGFALAGTVAVLLLGRWASPRGFSWKRLRPMLVYGLPWVPAGLGLWVTRSADRFLLRNLGDNAALGLVGTDEVGVYSIAVKVAMGVGLVFSAFTMAWSPFAYSILHHSNSRRVYARVLDVYSFLGCGLCTGAALLAPLFVRILATEPFYPAASCVPFLVFGCLFNGATFIAVLGCSIVKRSVPSAVAVGIGLATSIGLNVLLIPRYGRDGAAAANMAAWFVSMLYLFAASQRNHPIPYRWGRSIACLACSFAILGADRWFVPSDGLGAWFARAGLLLTFVPLGVAIGLIRWRRPAESDDGLQGGAQGQPVETACPDVSGHGAPGPAGP